MMMMMMMMMTMMMMMMMVVVMMVMIAIRILNDVVGGNGGNINEITQPHLGSINSRRVGGVIACQLEALFI